MHWKCKIILGGILVGAREAMKNHGYDKERALTLTAEELDELAKNVLKDKQLISSTCSVQSIRDASTMYFSSIHSIQSFDDTPNVSAEMENMPS